MLVAGIFFRLINGYGFCKKIQAVMCGKVMLRKEERRERVMVSGDILDTIMNHVVDDHSGESPKFVRDCEKKLQQKYTNIQTGSG